MALSSTRLHDRALIPMAVNHLKSKLLTQIDFRFPAVVVAPLELDDVEFQMVERTSHVVEPVLCFDQDFVETIVEGPSFLFIGESTEEPLSAPIASGAANPAVQHFPIVKLDAPLEPGGEVNQLGVGLIQADRMGHLIGHRYDGRRIIREGRLSHEDLVISINQPIDDLGSPFSALVLTEVLLDVFNLKRTLLQCVLANVIFQGPPTVDCLSFPVRHLTRSAHRLDWTRASARPC